MICLCDYETKSAEISRNSNLNDRNEMELVRGEIAAARMRKAERLHELLKKHKEVAEIIGLMRELNL